MPAASADVGASLPSIALFLVTEPTFDFAQGILAEYERAQILECSRRDKLHRARRGEVAVLGSPPYGYLYRKKIPESDAFYEIIEPRASVVRDVYRHYICDHMGIAAITRKLNARVVPTSA